jgi:hypothetical protein
MTNTLPSENGAEPRPKRPGKESAVGKQKHKRTAIDIGLALITPMVDQEFLDRYKLRDPLNRSLKHGSPKAPSTSPPNPRCLCGTSPHSTSWCVRRAGRSPTSPENLDRTGAARSRPTDSCMRGCAPTSLRRKRIRCHRFKAPIPDLPGCDAPSLTQRVRRGGSFTCSS